LDGSLRAAWAPQTARFSTHTTGKERPWQIRRESASHSQEIEASTRRLHQRTGTVLEPATASPASMAWKTPCRRLLDLQELVGLVLNLEEDNVGVVLLATSRRERGDTVKRTGRIAQVPVATLWSDAWFNALACPSTQGPHRSKEFRKIEIKAPESSRAKCARAGADRHQAIVPDSHRRGSAS